MRWPFQILTAFVVLAFGIALWPERPPRELIEAARRAAAIHDDRLHERRYWIVVDFERSVLRKRLWVVEAASGATVLAAHVSHGIGSGQLYARRFDGGSGSGESLVGAFVTAEEYRGRWGRSMRVDGLEARNASCRKRAIVFHAQWPPPGPETSAVFYCDRRSAVISRGARNAGPRRTVKYGCGPASCAPRDLTAACRSRDEPV